MIVRKNALAPIRFDGLTIFDFTGNRGLSSSLALIQVPPGATHAAAYSKRSDKYYLVVSGSIHFTLGTEEATLNAGDFCFVEQGQQFSYRNSGATEAQVVLGHTPSFELDSEVFIDPR